MKTCILFSALAASFVLAQAKDKQSISAVVSLFNGKDLTGWMGAKYEAKDGVLTCRGGHLITEKQYLITFLSLNSSSTRRQ